MISTSDPALWRPDTFLFGHAEVGCGHVSEIFLDVFLKPMGSAFEPLGYTGRFFVQSAGKLAGIVPCMDIAQQDFAVRIGKSGKGGTMHDESLLCEQPIFRRILDSDGIAEGQAVFVQLLIKTQSSHLSSNSIVTFSPMDCIKNGYFINREETYGRIASSYTTFQEGDIAFAKVTPCFENGNIAIMTGLSNGFGFGSSELFILRAKTVETRYLFYFLQNEQFKQLGCSTMTGTGGLKRVSSNFVRNCYMPLPSVEEQLLIADYLDNMCNALRSVIDEKHSLITDLESYKRSLIYEVVTGKRKVVQ